MTALVTKVMGGGMSAGQVKTLLGDVQNSMTAAGTSQSDAQNIGAAISRFTTVASGAGAILPAGAIGDECMVINAGANTLSLYPPVGHAIESLSTNTAISVPATSKVILKRISNLLWVGIDTFTQSGSGQSNRTVSAKLQEVQRSINDASSAGAAFSAAMTAGQALHATYGTEDLTGISQQTVSSDLVLIGEHDAILDAADSETLLLTGGGNIVLVGLTFQDFTQVVDGDQGATPVTPYLRVGDAFFSNGFNAVHHENPLTEGLITFSRFDTLTGVPIKVGYNNYANQELWNDLRIIGNRASDLVPSSAIDTYFAQINGKHAIVALNQVDTVTGQGAGEVWGVYTKQRYGQVLGNNIRGLTTSGSANPAAIQLKGADRGDTANGVQGFAMLAASNMLLGTTGRGIEISVEDTAIVGNYAEGFTFSILSGSDADGALIASNRIRSSAAVGNYGVHVTTSGDDQLIVGNLIDDVDRGVNLAQTSERNIAVVGNMVANCDGIAIQQSGTCVGLSVVGNAVDGADRLLTISGTVSRFLAVGNNWAADVGDGNSRAMEVTGVTSGLLDANAPFEIATTDATATNIFRLDLPTNTVCWVEATVIGTTAGTNRAVYKIGGLFHNAAGTATQEGSTVTLITAIESDATWGGAAFSPTGATVRVQVTGKAATSINWSATVTVQLVT